MNYYKKKDGSLLAVSGEPKVEIPGSTAALGYSKISEASFNSQLEALKTAEVERVVAERAEAAQAFADAGVPAEAVKAMFGVEVKEGKPNNGYGN